VTPSTYCLLESEQQATAAYKLASNRRTKNTWELLKKEYQGGVGK